MALRFISLLCGLSVVVVTSGCSTPERFGGSRTHKGTKQPDRVAVGTPTDQHLSRVSADSRPIYETESIGAGVAKVLIEGWSRRAVLSKLGQPESINDAPNSWYIRKGMRPSERIDFETELHYSKFNGDEHILVYLKNDVVVAAYKYWNEY